MTLLQVWTFIRHWFWLLVLGTLLAASASYIVSSRLPKVYEASTKLLVTPGPATIGTADYSSVLAAQNLTRTYAELAKTRPVVEAAIEAGHFNMPYVQAAAMLDATPIRDTQLLDITARGSDPEQAATLANLVSAALVQQAQAGQSGRFAVSKDSVAKQLDQLTTDIAHDTDQIGNLRAQPQSPERDGELARLEFGLTQVQQIYATVARSYEDLRLAEARSSDILAVADPAMPSQTPVQPRTLINVLVAALIGIGLAGSIGVLVDMLDDRLTSPNRVSRLTGLPVLGTVGARSQAASSISDRVLGSARQSRRGYTPRAAEPFRILGASLQVASDERPLRTVLITSCRKGEGKTSVAANLAIVLAQAGREVVVVDADLRAPTLHHVFGVDNRTGLSSLLLDDQQQPASGLVNTRVKGLRLLPSGPPPPDPSELMASQCMRNVLKALTQLADLVIIDTSPVLAVSDPIVLAGKVDAVLLVANGRRTRGPDAVEAVAALRSTGARVVGVVLNHVPDRPVPLERADELMYHAQLRPTIG